jgi:hypothetical protein
MSKKAKKQSGIPESKNAPVNPNLEKEIHDLISGKTKAPNAMVQRALELYQDSRIEFDRMGQTMESLEQQYNELRRQRLIQQGDVNAKAENLEYLYLESKPKTEEKESCPKK